MGSPYNRGVREMTMPPADTLGYQVESSVPRYGLLLFHLFVSGVLYMLSNITGSCHCIRLPSRTGWRDRPAVNTTHSNNRTWINVTGTDLDVSSLLFSFYRARSGYAIRVAREKNRRQVILSSFILSLDKTLPSHFYLFFLQCIISRVVTILVYCI